MKTIDLATYKRRAHFDFFRALDYPHVNLTAEVDVTALREFARDSGQSFFKCTLYLVSRAANEVPELRQRIRGETIVEHERVHPSYTFLNDDEVFSFTYVDYQPDAAAFVKAAAAAEDAVRRQITLADEPGRDDYLFVSAIPWVRFTSISHPIHIQTVDSVPRISWGRFEEQVAVGAGAGSARRWRMPLSIQAHHALVDGLHIGRFYERLEALLEDLAAAFEGNA